MAKNTETLTLRVEAETDQARRDLHALEEVTDKLSSEDATIVLKLEEENLASQLADIVSEVEKLDAEDATIDVKMEQGDKIIGDIDQIEAKLKELGQTDVKPLAGGLGDASTKLKEVHGEADQSRSVLANMVGNSVQDLGALGGVAGSAGVLIGQLAEYAADGNISLSGLAATAGPMIALAASVSVVTGALADQKAAAAAAEQQQEDFGKALADSANDAVGVTKALEGNIDSLRHFNVQAGTFGGLVGQYLGQLASNLPLIGGLFEDEGVDIIEVLSKVGLTLSDLGRALTDPVWGQNQFVDALRAANEQGAITDDQLEAVIQLLFKYQTNLQGAAAAQDVFNVNAQGANDILDEITKKADPLSQFTDQWETLFQDMADGSIDTQAAADAVNFLAANLGITREQVETLAKQHLDEQFADAKQQAEDAADAVAKLGDELADVTQQVNTTDFRSSAISDVFDQLDELSRLDTSDQLTAISDAWTAIDDAARNFPDSIVGFDLVPDNWEEVQNMPDDLKGITDAIGGFREAVQTQLAEAFTFGGPEALRQAAADITTEFEGPFREMMARNGASVEETDQAWQQFLRDVGLAPENIDMTVNLAIDQQKLQILKDIASGAGLEGENKINFDIAISNNDPTTALAILNEQLAGMEDPKQIIFTVDANTGEVETQLVDLTTPRTVPVSTSTDQTVTDTVQQVDELGNPVTVTVIAPKSPSLGAMDTLIDHVARDRTVDLNVKADNAGAINTILDAVADERTADIKAQATNVTPTDTTLDSLAMPTEDGRIAYIFALPTNVAPSAAVLDALAHDRIVHLRVQIDNYNEVERALDVLARPRTQVITTTTRLGGTRNGAAVN